MTITRFSIDGLAGRPGTCEFELGEGVNVFFGLNGSGKTSLLRLLHSALSDDPSSLQRVPFKMARLDVTVGEGSPFSFSLRKADLGESREARLLGGILARGADRAAWTVSPERLGPRPHGYLPVTRLYHGGDGGSHERLGLSVDAASLTEDDLERRFTDMLQRVWKDYVSDFTLRVKAAQEVGLDAILHRVMMGPLQDRQQVVSADEAFEAVSNFMRRQGVISPMSREKFLTRFAAEPLLRSAAGVLLSVEKAIATYTTPRKTFEALVSELFYRGKTLAFSDSRIRVEADGRDIGMGSLSTGEKHLLRILVETLYAGSSVIIVDEPELSLHVDWQRRLVGMMRTLNPRAQIVLATHSPEIMADLRDDEIYQL